MLFGGVFERLLKDSPLSVRSRAAIEHALPASALDALFDRTAERGYTRELLSLTRTGCRSPTSSHARTPTPRSGR